MPDAYLPRRAGRAGKLAIRGLQQQVTTWGDPANTTRPLLVMVHGWMDLGASFQFVIDAMDDARCVVALDWRGFGGSDTPAADSYWFPDYLGDLDALLDRLSPDAPVDLLGHSMGGNVVMAYAGVRPARIRKLVNLEGFGLPDGQPDEAPARLAQWLDELKTPQRLKGYADAAAVADRLRQNNPRLAADRAAWLATQWGEPRADGQWHLRADPAHKRVNPMLYRAAEAVAMWRAITAPTLWVEGSESRPEAWWRGRYSRAEFETRLAQVCQLERALLDQAGHMLHHDQPQALAAVIQAFLDR